MHNRFSKDLARFGPDSSHGKIGLLEAQAYCSRLAREHYENFTVASALLPRPLVRHFYNVYAYCRWADDLSDEVSDSQKSLALLRWWREELLCCYTGKARHPVMIALANTIAAFAIPPKPFLDLLIAFEQDQLVKRYQTFDQVVDYCRFSANPVGHLVLYLCRSFDKKRAALADFTCTALQLANFWQDVARDLKIGRVYLPEEDRKSFGYLDEDLFAFRFNPAFAALMRHEVARTRDLFYRGLPLLDVVPSNVRLDLELFNHGGLAILRKIEHCGYNVWKTRPRLTRLEKASLLVRATMRQLTEMFW